MLIIDTTFYEKRTHELPDETIIIIFAELANFNKKLEECGSDLEKMLYLLKNAGNLKNQAGWLRDKIYSQILDACEIARFSKEKKKQYTMDTYSERDYYAGLDYATHQGFQKGVAEGREGGREEGRKEVAVNLKNIGVPVEQIAKATGLSVEQISAL